MPPSIDSTSHRSPNFDDRPAGTAIRAAVLHTGEGTEAGDLGELTTPGTKKSAHYYVTRRGDIYELVPPEQRAWHAGESLYAGLRNWNDFAIGIESEHKRGQDWPAPQRAAFKALCEYLMAKYGIANGLIVAHRWIAIGPTGEHNRKADPTDWPDEQLKPWIAALRPENTDPLRAAQLPGLDRIYFCGTGFATFYRLHGGKDLFGYPRGDELRDRGLDGRDCTVMPFERSVLKYIEGEGVHLALLSEAVAEGWVL